MLWTAVYLPSSSPTTPSDDSCAPYPVPGGNPEDAPLSRCVWGVLSKIFSNHKKKKMNEYKSYIVVKPQV